MSYVVDSSKTVAVKLPTEEKFPWVSLILIGGSSIIGTMVK